jgi:hypothetical protein
MGDDRDTKPDPSQPDPSRLLRDPDALKESHGRTGRLLKQAGLPFEEEEFEEQGPADRASEAREPDAPDGE